MPTKIETTTITQLKTIKKYFKPLKPTTTTNNNKLKLNLVELKTTTTTTTTKKQDKSHKILQKMSDNKKAPVITPNTQRKQFVPLKSATNTKTTTKEHDIIHGSMHRSKSINDAKSNGLGKKSSPQTPNNKNIKNAKDAIKSHQVDMHQLDAMLLPNSKINKPKQDTYSTTHSIAKESWQQNYKECQRHQRLVKDDNLEKKCSSCGILYVLCETCRKDHQIPFNDDDTCIDCAPSVIFFFFFFILNFSKHKITSGLISGL
jgi:hypothetical protein